MLQDLANRLTLPGLPDWAGLVVLLVLLLVALAYLLMPFSVFGVKGRLDAIEAQLDEIQAELRTLALRLPEPGRGRRPPVEEDWAQPVQPPRRAEAEPPSRAAPPVPPPAAWPETRGGRAEPRVEWPRPPR
ncbi:hypothetical protein [Falsiroseomonas sp.]|uniref:hypothetical protein n=1 Tax=Falsiroseomonas sp. TaxID=2870721 RepID=UPI003564054F